MNATYAWDRLRATARLAPLRLRLKTERGLSRILAAIIGGIDELADGINGGVLSAAAWREGMADLLAVGHVAAYQEGRDSQELGAGSRRQLNATLAEQAGYLNRFAAEIDQRGWEDRKDRARATLYAGALKGSYWRGAAFGLDLPRYPGDGSTPCIGNCTCRLRIVWLDEEELDADVYWELGGAERHCDQCPRIAAEWAPLRFRGGRRA